MDQESNIDTVQMGYEETAYSSQQSQFSRISAAKRSKHVEVQDALTLAHMLQQLRSQKLDLQTEMASGGA